MALLAAEAEKLSAEDLQRGVIEEIIDKEALFALLPFKKTDGKAYVYNRENTISEADFINPVTDTVPEGAATFTEVTAKLRVLIGDVDVDKFLDTTMSDTNSQKAIQIAQKAKGLARKFRRTLAIGDAGVTTEEFDGVAALTDPGQEIVAGVNGAVLSLDMLDELLDAVPNGADVIMMRSGTLRAFRALLRAMGAAAPEHVMLENFGMQVPAHNGVPIVVNDFLPIDETMGTSNDTCSVYAIRLNEVDGLCGLYGGESAGIMLEDIGTVQNKDASRTRVKWYVGTALHSTKSLAAVKGMLSV